MPIYGLIAKAFEVFESSPQNARVKLSIPILYFGDLTEYRQSALRIVTVALNPSSKEFPVTNEYQRFPAAQRFMGDTPLKRESLENIKQAFDSYFVESPYREWFNNLQSVLKGFDASYFPGSANTALHTDLLSPVATDPTWNRLDRNTQCELARLGVPLWHDLIKELRPDILLVSVARRYLDLITFFGKLTPSGVYTFDGKKNYPIHHSHIQITAAHSSDIIFGRAAQKPCGHLKAAEKELLGKHLKGRLLNW